MDAARVIDDMGSRRTRSAGAAEILARDPAQRQRPIRDRPDPDEHGPRLCDRPFQQPRRALRASPTCWRPPTIPRPTAGTAALDFALSAMSSLPRAKVSVEADRVAITAITDSAQEKARLEQNLHRMARARPGTAGSRYRGTAPRHHTLHHPVPDHGGRRAALTPAPPIRRWPPRASSAPPKPWALRARGAPWGWVCRARAGRMRSRLPSRHWPSSAVGPSRSRMRISRSLRRRASSQSDFDTVVGELENALPPVFALQAQLPKDAGPRRRPAGIHRDAEPRGAASNCAVASTTTPCAS